MLSTYNRSIPKDLENQAEYDTEQTVPLDFKYWLTDSVRSNDSYEFRREGSKKGHGRTFISPAFTLRNSNPSTNLPIQRFALGTTVELIHLIVKNRNAGGIWCAPSSI